MSDCRAIDLKSVADQRGTLYVLEGLQDIPFLPKRIFYITGMEPEQPRGGHAHRATHQAIFCLSGRVGCATRRPGLSKRIWTLEAPGGGLYLPPLTWLDFRALTSAAICLVLASEHYDPTDYLDDAEAFDQEEGVRR